MKWSYFALCLFLIPILFGKAQAMPGVPEESKNFPYIQNSLTLAGTSKSGIVYQFPKDNDLYIQPRTTLIIRLSKTLVTSHAREDFSFSVHGESSGDHLGKVVLSDDGETIIFKPDDPFTLGENVRVTFGISGSDALSPVSYGFRITSMSESEQAYWRKFLYENEEKKNEAFRHQTAAKNSHQELQGVPHDSLPWYFPPITIDRNDKGSDQGNIFLTPVGSTLTKITKEFAFISIMDSAGTPLYTNEITGQAALTADFKKQPNNALTYPDPPRSVFYEMNLQFEIIDSFRCGNGQVADTHDFELLPNGNAMLEALNPVLIDNVIVYDNVIQILDKSKNVIFQWNALNHFQISDATHEDTTASFIDFAHINSIQTDTDGNIIASFRNLDEVTKIDRQTGGIIWHWGGKHNQFSFVGDTLQFSHQHDPRRISNWHITLWDNGNFHSVYYNGTATVAPSSRAVEYDLDETHFTATAMWEYKNVPFSNAAGNVQRLDNGNTFIGLGDISSPSAMEVTSSGDLVYQLSLPDQTVSYRVYRFKLPTLAVVRDAGPAYSFGLRSIYPNPAESATTITFFSNDAGLAKIEFINLLGHTMRSSTQNLPSGGEYSFNFDTHDFPGGMYYCKFSQNGKLAVKTVVVLR